MLAVGLLRLARFVALVAFRFRRRARIHTVAFAVIVACAGKDRASDQGGYDQEGPASLQNDLSGRRRFEC